MIMLVENDVYELPLAVEDNMSRMCNLLNKTNLCDVNKYKLSKAIKRGSIVRLNDGRFGRFIKIEKEE